jgi:hypothetical protein
MRAFSTLEQFHGCSQDSPDPMRIVIIVVMRGEHTRAWLQLESVIEPHYE